MEKWKDLILMAEGVFILIVIGVMIGYHINNSQWLGVLHKDLELSITQPAPPVRGKK